MRTRIAASLLCLLLALTLAGCVHGDRAVTLNGDGTGVYTFAVGYSSQMMSLGGGTLVTAMNGFGERVKQDGGSYTRYDDSGYTYWKYVRPFGSVSQLDSYLSQVPQIGANSSVTSTDAQNSFQVVDQPGFFGSTYHVTGHLSLLVPNANQATRDLLKDARETFAVTMPGWVSQQTGGDLNGNTVTYTVHLGESTTIDVTGGGLNVPHVALVAGGLLLALALFFVGLVLVRRDTRRLDAPPAAVASPYYMPTQPAVPGSDEMTYPATPDYPAADPRSSPSSPSLPPLPPLSQSTPTPE